ncbi:hypothetical protein EUX98_g6531 [Antrodiella citrinella]|uniref:Uncharacterized protein n=1 Tax=Antrodiella citrinella TaxID=2447956 RepID=A0A4S4MRB0_9APHY|nr:hypothetical protein EUX98_g6531 [Antrodiella citrinella]
MKFSTFVLSAAALFAASTISRPIKRDVNPALVPPFGIQAGVNPDGTGNCDGIPDANGKPILIPCACPPDEASFLASLNANVAAGHVINNPSVQLSFPEDSSKASQSARLNAAATTLQNLHGPGQGCPVAGTTFSAQQQAINAEPADGTAPAAPAAAPPPANNAASSSGTATPAQVAALAPSLGFTAGKNPTGTGNCDGAVNGPDGKPIAVPCACPPDQADFITALQADVAAGHAVNNPSVQVTFPIDNSVASQSARIEAAIIALQNLHGPGQGCPVVSTTLSAQQQALQ